MFMPNHLVKYLRLVEKLTRENCGGKQFAYNSVEHFVLQNGQLFDRIRSNVALKMPKQCFKNAFEGMVDGLVYVEGFSISIIPVLHAWNVDPVTGEVVDSTWGKDILGTLYYGVPFDPSYVRRTVLRQKRYGLLCEYRTGYPLLTGEHADFKHIIQPRDIA